MKPQEYYADFIDLMLYAEERAQGSAKRRAPQDFEYWYSIREWALRMMYEGHRSDDDLLTLLREQIDITNSSTAVSIKATAHARAIHLRRMLRNRNVTTKRLSLRWMYQVVTQMAETANANE